MSYTRLRDVGWAWDGQALDYPCGTSIFGLGEGARWFGLTRVCAMFHPNTRLALEKLAVFDEVICDISKWDFKWVRDVDDGRFSLRLEHHGTLARKLREADNLSRLSLEFPNLTGGFDDDLLGKVRAEGLTPEQYAGVGVALKRHNPALQHWGVVYAHELDPEDWRGFESILDVVNLWVWKSEDLVHLDRYVARARAIFPNQPIVLGCYLHDFTLGTAVPMDRLRFQWEKVARYVADGLIAGYSILGGFLIDAHETEARWVRDFIAAH
ncbi:MAG: hypothetical protein N2512_12805 [Armatimonadetes bacterium]|nr:hypothetical protein [Armatimonadota bacterium]